MKITDKDLEKFIAIYKKKFGVELSSLEATEKALQVILGVKSFLNVEREESSWKQ